MLQKAILPFLLLGASLISNAQSDTIAVLATKKDTIVVKAKNDTIQIGSMLIVKKEEAEKEFKTIIEEASKTDAYVYELQNYFYKIKKYEQHHHEKSNGF